MTKDPAFCQTADTGRDAHTTTLNEIMSRPVVACSPDDDYQFALGLMMRYQLERIPAVDNSGCVVGSRRLISRSELPIRR